MSKVIHLSENEFKSKVLQSSGSVIADFWAPWCGPCRALGSILDGLSEENSSITIYKINVDECSSLAEEYGISSIPTMMFFKDGTMIGQSVGVLTKSDILSKF